MLKSLLKPLLKSKSSIISRRRGLCPSSASAAGTDCAAAAAQKSAVALANCIERVQSSKRVAQIAKAQAKKTRETRSSSDRETHAAVPRNSSPYLPAMTGRTPLLLSLLVHACRGDGDAICRDGSHDCPNWAQSGNCESNAIYMAKHCRLSCKLCEPCKDLAKKCAEWKANGECEVNKGDMMQNCAASCGGCSECADTQALCGDWVDADPLCEKNRDYMIEHCAKSCGLCGGCEPGEGGEEEKALLAAAEKRRVAAEEREVLKEAEKVAAAEEQQQAEAEAAFEEGKKQAAKEHAAAHPPSTSSFSTFMAIVVSLLFALVVGGLTMLRGGAQPKQRSAGSKDGLKPREDWHAQ